MLSLECALIYLLFISMGTLPEIKTDDDEYTAIVSYRVNLTAEIRSRPEGKNSTFYLKFIRSVEVL